MNKDLLQKICTPFRGERPAGEAIRYTALYDQIQEARRSEDETLPQGIWKSTLKKADWPLVASLCTEGLLNQSKDLQLAGWLTESWVSLHGLEGLSQGVSLLHGLSESFWNFLHPALHPEDPTGRVAPYEWIDHQLPTTLLSICITETTLRDLKNFSYSDWVTIQHLEMTSKKQKDPAGYLQKEAQKGLPHPSMVRASVQSTLHRFYQHFSEEIQEILGKIEHLENFLKERLAKDAPLFYNLKKQLEAIKRFAMQGQQLTQEIPPPPAPALSASKSPEESPVDILSVPVEKSLSKIQEIDSRENAYAQLAHLADFLSKIDPHSPTPHLLRKAIFWQNKTFLELFQDFRQDPQALQVFLALLGDPPSRAA